MFKNILVPLDGSVLAEVVLPMATFIATKTHSELSLIHVIEQNAPKLVHQERHLTNAEEAGNYLSELALRYKSKVVKISWHVHTAEVNNVAKSIVSHTKDESKHDLVILCAHGNSGMRDFFYGNIAQQVVSNSNVPVMIIKPAEKVESNLLKNILVPLDNESLHDEVIPFSEGFSRFFESNFTLLCVIPTLSKLSGEQAATGNLMPTTTSAYLDITEEIAVEHFQEHLDDYKKKGISADVNISRGDPAQTIISFAKNNEVDLIMMATHGSTGMDAFWNRSVTATVARQSQIPLLLIPIPSR